jgi:hypothetical protein
VEPTGGSDKGSEVNETFEAFAKSRGFEAKTLQRYGLRMAVESDALPYDGDWIAIPYRNLSGVWHNKYRNLTDHGPKYHADHGSEGHLYNPKLLGPNSDVVWLTEGEFDCLSMVALGHDAIGVPGVTGFKEVWKHLFTDSTVIVAFDPDEAGEKAAVKVASLFRNYHVFDAYPDGMDLNEWFVQDANDMFDVIDEWMKGRGL